MSIKENIAIICLGANTPEAHETLAEALQYLQAKSHVIARSGQYFTDPEYAGETVPYLNEVIKISTADDYDTFHADTKAYEASIRAHNSHSGLVNLDIDIVRWNAATLRPADAAAAYFRQGELKI